MNSTSRASAPQRPPIRGMGPSPGGMPQPQAPPATALVPGLGAPWIRVLALSTLLANGSCRTPEAHLPEPQRHQVQSARAIALEVHRSVERSIALQFEAGEALVLAEHYGDVTVTADAGGSPRCHATVKISASDSAGADALERTIGLTSVRTETGLRILLDEPERDDDLVYVASASLEIFVPPGTPLEIQLERGSLNGIGPFGQARIETKRGDLRLRRVDGGVIARSGVGDIKLRQCTGGPVRASTDEGMLALLGSRSETVKLESARGRIVVNTASGGMFRCLARQGSVRLIGVKAEALVEAGTSVRVEDFEGPGLFIEKGEGRAILKNVRTEALELTSISGAVEVERARATSLVINADSGSLTLTDVSGDLTAKTGAGEIDAALLGGRKSILYTEWGGITVREAKGHLITWTGRGRTEVTRVQGAIELSSDEGAITASGVFSGVLVDGAEGGVVLRARAASEPNGPWRIASGHGDLVLALPEGLGFALEARAQDGIIDSAFPIVVGPGMTQEAGTLRGDVAGGGPALELFSERGNIALRRTGK